MSHTRSHRPAATSSRQKFEHKVSPGQMAKYERFMQTADEKSKNFVKEVMAEQYMEMTAARRGMKVTVTPADKGMRGGPDADMRNGKGHELRAEAKAENSPLSKGQRNAEKTLVGDPNQALEHKGQFGKASRMDQAAADASQKTLGKGGSISYEVHRTKSTSTGFETKVTSKTYAAAETGTQGGPVTVRHDPSLKSDGFAEPGRATVPLNAPVHNTGVRSSAAKPPANAAGAAAPRSVGTRGAASGQPTPHTAIPTGPRTATPTGPRTAVPGGPSTASPTATGPAVSIPGGPSVSAIRTGGTPSGKF